MASGLPPAPEASNGVSVIIRPFPVLRRLISNWRKRRRLYDLQHLDDHALEDIGLTRTDVATILGQPLSVDPVWDLERRARLTRKGKF